MAHFARRRFAGDGDEGIVEAGPFDAQSLDSGIAVDQRLQERFGSARRELESPLAPDQIGIIGQGRPPWPVCRSGTEMDDRAEAAARLVHIPLEYRLTLGNDGDALAQPFGVGDDMGREDDGHTGSGLIADQLLQLLLVQCIEPRKGLVQNDQPGLVDDRAEQLDGLGHALRQVPDRPFRPILMSGIGEKLECPAPSFPDRKAAKGAHECDRFGSRHRRVKATLLGQIADLPRNFERPVVAEQASRPRRRVDDSQQHSDGGGLAGSVRAEDAGDAALRHGKADVIDRPLAVEILGQVPRFGGNRSFPHALNG